MVEIFTRAREYEFGSMDDENKTIWMQAEKFRGEQKEGAPLESMKLV